MIPIDEYAAVRDAYELRLIHRLREELDKRVQGMAIAVRDLEPTLDKIEGAIVRYGERVHRIEAAIVSIDSQLAAIRRVEMRPRRKPRKRKKARR